MTTPVSSILLLLWAQAAFAAAPDPRAVVPGLTRDLLEDAAGARVRCQVLARLVNEESDRWGRLHAGDLDAERYLAAHQESGEDWAVARGECSKVQQAIEDAAARAMLEEEVRRIDAVWNLQHRAAEAIREGRPTPVLSSIAADAGRMADRARDWINDSAVFWAGGAISAAARGGCGLDTWVLVEEEAAALRRVERLPVASRTQEALAPMEQRRAASRKGMEECRSDKAPDRLDVHAARRRLQVLDAVRDAIREDRPAGAAWVREGPVLHDFATCRVRWRRTGELAVGCTD